MEKRTIVIAEISWYISQFHSFFKHNKRLLHWKGMKIAINSSSNKSLPNLKKGYETRWLAASIVKRAARCQFHQDELTGQACLEQPIIPGVSRQENILTSGEKKF